MDRYAEEMIARGRPSPTTATHSRKRAHRRPALGLATGRAADLALPPDRDELIAYGPLLSDDGTTWLGTAALVRAQGPDTARAVLTPDLYADIEVHNWQFGGRPS
ncbi:hypothetical protein [Streptomyces luteireticuli]|uniref:hypothetical protein n=1 Tax=Streptomyces luteireticuli TaxID=173858 RepID=UPI0035569233